jgi:signal transduction histidine kinase
MSLHRILSLFALVVAALALGASVALVLLTTYLHHMSLELETGLQSVRLAEEMQIDLLMHSRTREPFVRTRLEADLRYRLQKARQYVTGSEQDSYLTETERLILTYFDKARATPAGESDQHLEQAFGALRRVIDTNVERAESSIRASARWDEMADWIGLGFSAVLMVGIAALLIWLRRAAFQPLFEIQSAIRDFAAGRKETRAPERGPEELRLIARQFNDMAVALERQYENQLSFLASVAHDLRNPIGTLKASADILSAERELPPETISKLMAIIKRQVHSLNRMIGDLLDTSRIEAGHLELRITECDARTIGQNVFDLFNSAAMEHHLALELPETPVHLRCDPLRIEQVLHNLISNAVKYSPLGTRVELKIEQAGEEVRFQVTDEGVGIPHQDLPYIFEPFRRTAASKGETPGVGLGLSVAQRIVRAHGGRIQVESQVGRGTIFRVYLPAFNATLSKLTA